MKYEVTITLKPGLYQFDAKKQFEMTKGILWNIFEPYQSTVVAELTQDHNVHYHCMVDLGSIVARDKFLNRFRAHCKVFGRKSCKQVMFEDSYRAYMKKSLDDVREILGDPIIRDSFGVFKTLF